MYSTHFLASDFDITKVVEANIKQAFVVNLPFRIKIGEQLILNMGDEHKSIVVLRNKVTIPTLEYWNEIKFSKTNWSEYWTRALIFMESPPVKKEELERTRETGKVAFTKPFFEALQILNQAILSYATAPKEIFGGHPIELFSDMDFFNNLEWEITFVVNEGNSFDQGDIDQIFSLQPEKAVIMGEQYNGTLEDLPSERVWQNWAGA